VLGMHGRARWCGLELEVVRGCCGSSCNGNLLVGRAKANRGEKEKGGHHRWFPRKTSEREGSRLARESKVEV
jgi:hypothetical protein